MRNIPQVNQMVKITDCIAPSFYGLHHDLKDGKYSDFYLKGGRGSTKSSFPSIEIVKGIVEDPLANAMCAMKTGTLVETGVFAQIQWAIDKLQLTDYFKANYQKYYFTYKQTGQKIYCKGCDEANKFKSIKLIKGYFKYQWFEEFDLFNGIEEIRKVQQSLTRAGLKKAVRFYSYNPPQTMDHWANKYILNLQKDINEGIVKNTVISHTTYLTVPKEWLGEQFIEDAETLKRTNYRAYAHEYLGEITGTGGAVFPNVCGRKITNDEINNFGLLRRGIDWGYATDPFAYVKMYYDVKYKNLYIFKEYYKVGASFDTIALNILPDCKGYDLIRADSAEPRSNSELSNRSLNVIGVKKGAGSVEHGLRWLQGLNSIIVDFERCPNAYREFAGYEYEKDKSGDFKSSYPDKNNHTIDAARYGLEQEIGYNGGYKFIRGGI